MPSSKNLIDEFPVALTARDLTGYDVYLCKEDKSLDGRVEFNTLFANLGSGTGGLRLGSGAGSGLTTGSNNTTIGVNAGSGIKTGTNNLVITDGSVCPLDSTDSFNVVLGVVRPFGSVSGASVLKSIAVGFNTIGALTSGSLTDVVGIGDSAWPGMTTGTLTNSLAVGDLSGANVTSGFANTFIGSNSGTNGYNSGASNFATAIGAQAVCTADNQITLGRQGVDTTVASTLISGAGVVWSATATAAAATASSTAGVGLTLTADNAVAGTTNAGAAAGGPITILSGNAARLVSGSATGGPIGIQTGTGIGGGAAGTLNLNTTNNGPITLGNGTLTLGDGSAAYSITQPNAASGSGKGITVTAGSAASGSGTNGGNLNFVLGAKDGAGTAGLFQILNNATSLTVQAYLNNAANPTFVVNQTANGLAFGVGGTTRGMGSVGVLTTTIIDGSGSKGLIVDSSGSKLSVTSGYVIGFQSSSSLNAANVDGGFSRLGAAAIALGNGTVGDFTGSLKLTTLNLQGLVSNYNAVATAGWGVPAIYGKDSRTGLTSADGAPITLYTATAANQLYRVMADIFATAAVTGTANYAVAWTENGTAQSIAVTATAINVLGTQMALIRPDNGTAITAQLTGTFTGTFTVAGIVEQIA